MTFCAKVSESKTVGGRGGGDGGVGGNRTRKKYRLVR